MDIQNWFDNKGTYQDGLKLYSELPSKSNLLLRSLSKETAANFLKLKYELKKALNTGSKAIIQKEEKTVSEPKKEAENKSLLQVIVEQSANEFLEKETMAMYPIELHSTYRERISDFYRVCELKFKLNAIHPDDEAEAYELMLEMEDLWERIDRAWFVLNHWKDTGRIMPVKATEDFSKLSAIQLVKRRDQLQTSVSKRTKTLSKIQEEVDNSPEDKTKLNLYNRKKEQLQQLLIDLETIRNLLNEK